MDVPKNVKVGLILYAANIFIGYCGVALQINSSPPELSRPFLVSAALAALLFLIFLGYRMFRGSNLFRLLNAFFVIAGNLSAVTGFHTVTFYHPAGFYIYWAASAFAVGAVIALFTPSANVWFEVNRNVKA